MFSIGSVFIKRIQQVPTPIPCFITCWSSIRNQIARKSEPPDIKELYEIFDNTGTGSSQISMQEIWKGIAQTQTWGKYTLKGAHMSVESRKVGPSTIAEIFNSVHFTAFCYWHFWDHRLFPRYLNVRRPLSSQYFFWNEFGRITKKGEQRNNQTYAGPS